MKKLNDKARRWFRNRIKDQLRRTQSSLPKSNKERTSHQNFDPKHRSNNYHTSYVKIWQGGAEETAVCTREPSDAPDNLCFRDNHLETIRFFHNLRSSFDLSVRRKVGGFVKRRNDRAMPRIRGYSDFAKVNNISMASAVVLAADYDRLKYFLNEVPPTVNLTKWNSVVVTRLHQLGFFRILGHEPDPKLVVSDGDFLLMRISRSDDSRNLEEVDRSLMMLGEYLSEDSDLISEKVIHSLTIISEAMSNVTQHAYHPDLDYKYDHIGAFWISAEADRSAGTLRIVLFDQGSTIPVTYPRVARTDKVTKFLARALKQADRFDYANDGTYIRTALRHGGSRTDEAYRGKGFPQMSELLNTLGGGELRIYSRGGWCVRTQNGKVTSGSYEYSIGGTLIEWKIEL